MGGPAGQAEAVAGGWRLGPHPHRTRDLGLQSLDHRPLRTVAAALLVQDAWAAAGGGAGPLLRGPLSSQRLHEVRCRPPTWFHRPEAPGAGDQLDRSHPRLWISTPPSHSGSPATRSPSGATPHLPIAGDLHRGSHCRGRACPALTCPLPRGRGLWHGYGGDGGRQRGERKGGKERGKGAICP